MGRRTLGSPAAGTFAHGHQTRSYQQTTSAHCVWLPSSDQAVRSWQHTWGATSTWSSRIPGQYHQPSGITRSCPADTGHDGTRCTRLDGVTNINLILISPLCNLCNLRLNDILWLVYGFHNPYTINVTKLYIYMRKINENWVLSFILLSLAILSTRNTLLARLLAALLWSRLYGSQSDGGGNVPSG
jgi:hypothetical protein